MPIRQLREPVNPLVGVAPDPGHDRTDGAPGDPHQFAHRGFRTRTANQATVSSKAKVCPA